MAASHQEGDGKHPHHWETQTRLDLSNGSLAILFRLAVVVEWRTYPFI